MTERLSSKKREEIEASYRAITERIAEAKAKAGRTDEIRLMAVTKTVAPEAVNLAVSLGVRLLGENRVQEFLEKRDEYVPEAEIHFIGGLQTNKVKYIIDKVAMIHSVDNERLLREIDRRAGESGLIKDVLFEVNIGGEESKNGVPPDRLGALTEAATACPNVRVRGLMTIPPIDRDGSSERYFERMERLFTDLKSESRGEDGFPIDTLSMGMSGDFETAIRYGSTIVRIGSLLFGYRKY
ncbi:MAG: YggS family pyridoxal phosphate-dependent enzyme [Bacteroides sp.]|nr:YggS family pyridoxal phosphate-dependent enzyme [Eubacterium sp.]MCM1417338.1 YggS family pyridoxal phosphate-dependent enzyme [Roseburia sp.]MCM1461469.1 YggS family pyridoxal phosphate-dependent enzyme [Bacteroides sp.]